MKCGKKLKCLKKTQRCIQLNSGEYRCVPKPIDYWMCSVILKKLKVILNFPITYSLEYIRKKRNHFTWRIKMLKNNRYLGYQLAYRQTHSYECEIFSLSLAVQRSRKHHSSVLLTLTESLASTSWQMCSLKEKLYIFHYTRMCLVIPN